MKFTVLTLGCKVNLYESEGIINDLKSHGCEYVSNDEEVDLFIVNSCTVTKVADQKSRQMIHQARRNNPKAVIACCGCYAQLNSNEALDICDIVVGNSNKLSIYNLYCNFIQNKDKQVQILNVLDHPCFEEMDVESLETHTRAFIKIQDGCENFCSYCAIPYSRGSIRSRKKENIINEINGLVLKGVKEVILSGINTGTYGKDFGNINLASLITSIMEETSLYRLRLSSIELSEISDELLEVLRKYNSRIAHHLHIPLQAGSDTVLERMHRHYKTLEYFNKIQKIKEIYPDVALTTDILAGFVGETIDEFNEMLRFIDSIGFYEMHVFPYSVREGTLAASMSGHLDKATKTNRAKEISLHAKKMRIEYMNLFLDKEFEVIAENEKDGFYHGKTSNYLDLAFKSDIDLTGKIVLIKITKLENEQLFGEVIRYE